MYRRISPYTQPVGWTYTNILNHKAVS
jgi:hypothetical protein